MVRPSAFVACAAAALSALASAYTELSDDSMRAIPFPGHGFDIHKGELLAPILTPRVPGTPGSAKVRKHFVDYFSKQLPTWQISLQESAQTTPLSDGDEVPFVNIIAKRSPPNARVGETSYLTLVAHYDSKLEPQGFIGATDSAAPCAMLMHIARAVDTAMSSKWNSDDLSVADAEQLETKRGVQIIFLDGEEAFHSWTEEDSLYGARALAEDWETQLNPFYTTYRNPLDSIDLFVLLDLLGAPGPSVPSYFKTTHWAYKKLCEIEGRMHRLGLKQSSPNFQTLQKGGAQADLESENPFFHECDKPDNEFWLGGLVGDDHMPFLQRGVEVLHLIPHPFPSNWHSTGDNGDNLDLPTTEDWAVIVSTFVAEWMDLDGHLGPANSSSAQQMARRAARDELS